MTEVVNAPGGFRRAAWRILKQAWPVLISQWASMAFGVMDTAMTGHASPTDLAAMALAASVFISVFVGLMGVLHAMIPIIAQDFGGGRMGEIGRTWAQGVWLALALSVVGGAAMLFPDIWLSMSGDVDPAVRALMTNYLRCLVVALPAALLFRTVYALSTAVSRPKVIMAINIVGVCLKACFNWVLIYGKFGVPALGAVGAGMSSAIVFWISALISVTILLRDPFYARFKIRLYRPDWKILGGLLRLGLPMGASYLIEVTSFTFMALLVARGGTFSLGSHQIMSNLAALCFMMPMSIGIATSTLTAQAIGAGTMDRARRTALTGLGIGMAGAVLTVLLLVVGRGWIVNAYTSDAQVAVGAMALIRLLVVFHLLDAAQCITSYILRAHKIAVAPMLIQAVTLWGIGLGGGWWLGFEAAVNPLAGLIDTMLPGAPVGAATLWLMAILAMVLTTASLQYWYHRVLRRAPGIE
jgi:MATE family multidrug resistance protein